MKRMGLIVAATLTLGACTESPQKLQTSTRDTPAYTGTGSNFMLKGAATGDKAGWESRLKARGQYGQNDYARVQ